MMTRLTRLLCQQLPWVVLRQQVRGLPGLLILSAVAKSNSPFACRSPGTAPAAALRLRPRHVLHFGRVLTYGGQPRWDLSFDGVDGVALAPARYCYVANLELGLLPSADR